MNNIHDAHCEWELPLAGCTEREPMMTILIANAAWAFVIAAIKFGLLWDRIINKKSTIFVYEHFIRPKPIESMLLFGGLYNVVRVLNTICLLTDVAPKSVFRAILSGLPWQFGLCSFSCYLFGLAHAVCSSNQLIGRCWYRLSLRMEVTCAIYIALPFVTNNICSLLSAVYFNQGNPVKAKMFKTALSCLWILHCFSLSVWILIAGNRLIMILKRQIYIQLENTDSPTVHKLKHGLSKVRMTMCISLTSMFILFAINFYSVMSELFPRNKDLNFALAVVFLFDGTLASTLITLTMLFNPKALTSFSLSSSHELESSDNTNITNFAIHKDDPSTSSTNTSRKDSYHFRPSLDYRLESQPNYNSATHTDLSDIAEHREMSAIEIVPSNHPQ